MFSFLKKTILLLIILGSCASRKRNFTVSNSRSEVDLVGFDLLLRNMDISIAMSTILSISKEV